jgi:hypothetical protein
MRRCGYHHFSGRTSEPRVVADVQVPTVLGIWGGADATLSSDEGSKASSAELMSPRDQHRHTNDGGQTEHDPH